MLKQVQHDGLTNGNFLTTPKNELLFLALGGSDEIGMNVNLYGCDGKWLMVDLGLTFAGADYPGVDLVRPSEDDVDPRIHGNSLMTSPEWGVTSDYVPARGPSGR